MADTAVGVRGALPEIIAPRRTRDQIAERFMRFVQKSEDGCWLWTGSRDNLGYGRFSVSSLRRARFSHRVAYELFVERVPVGLTLDHLCRVPRCVNPDHLEPVTQGENVMRSDSVSGLNSRKTHCIHGHEFTPENTIRNRKGWRRCRTCTQAHEARRNERRRLARRGVAA